MFGTMKPDGITEEAHLGRQECQELLLCIFQYTQDGAIYCLPAGYGLQLAAMLLVTSFRPSVLWPFIFFLSTLSVWSH